MNSVLVCRSVKVGDGDPCSSKDAGVVDVSESMKVPENNHIGTGASPCQKVVGSIAQMKRITLMHAAWATNSSQNIYNQRAWVLKSNKMKVNAMEIPSEIHSVAIWFFVWCYSCCLLCDAIQNKLFWRKFKFQVIILYKNTFWAWNIYTLLIYNGGKVKVISSRKSQLCFSLSVIWPLSNSQLRESQKPGLTAPDSPSDEKGRHLFCHGPCVLN